MPAPRGAARGGGRNCTYEPAGEPRELSEERTGAVGTVRERAEAMVRSSGAEERGWHVMWEWDTGEMTDEARERQRYSSPPPIPAASIRSSLSTMASWISDGQRHVIKMSNLSVVWCGGGRLVGRRRTTARGAQAAVNGATALVEDDDARGAGEDAVAMRRRGVVVKDVGRGRTRRW